MTTTIHEEWLERYRRIEAARAAWERKTPDHRMRVSLSNDERVTFAIRGTTGRGTGTEWVWGTTSLEDVLAFLAEDERIQTMMLQAIVAARTEVDND